MAKGSVAAEDGCTFWSDGHLCERGVRHCDQCLCKCGHRWTRDEPLVLPEVERATVVNVSPGDVLVFETQDYVDMETITRLAEQVKTAVGQDVTEIYVERGRFAGVVRPERHDGAVCSLRWLSGEPCPKRLQHAGVHECGRPSCHDREHECKHCGRVDGPRMIEVSTVVDVASGRKLYVSGEPGARP